MERGDQFLDLDGDIFWLMVRGDGFPTSRNGPAISVGQVVLNSLSGWQTPACHSRGIGKLRAGAAGERRGPRGLVAGRWWLLQLGHDFTRPAQHAGGCD